MDTPSTPHHALLKAHKAFLRRPVQIGHPPLAHATHNQLWQHERQHEALPKSAQIESWIPEPDVIHLTLEHSLPLTPPANSPEDEGVSWIEGSLPDDNKVTTRSVSSGITTPVIQRSPPTPETTPPRANQDPQWPARPNVLPNQSVGTRTDSFKTACENLSSDDESTQPPSPSMKPSRQKWLKQAAHTRLNDVGLGLGLESPPDDASLREETPKASPKKQDFVTFEGSWGIRHDTPASTGDNGAASESQVTQRPRPRKVSRSSSGRSLTAEENATSTKQSLTLRQRLEKSRNSPTSLSTEKFAKEIDWPLQDNEHIDLDAKVREVDNRRLSQMSTTSTVEAVVIDSPFPKNRQTLRHTGKFSKIDSLSMNWNRNSLVPNHGLRHSRKLRHTGSPDQIKRGSFASDIVVTGQSRKRQDSVPVIVIPERRSSLGASAPGSRRLSRTTSLTSRQQSSRPTTAPQGATGDFDGPQPDHRTMSAKLPSRSNSNRQRKASRDISPHPHVESSTVAANIGRKMFRASSATSGSGISSNGLQDHPTALPQTLQIDGLQEPLHAPNTTFDRSISPTGLPSGRALHKLRRSRFAPLIPLRRVRSKLTKQLRSAFTHTPTNQFL